MRIHALVSILILLISSQLSAPAAAQSLSFHLDIAVRATNGRLEASFCGDPALGCETPPVLELLGLDPSQLPIDAASGHVIFITDFADLDGGQYSTDDPGFQGLAGWLPPDFFLYYEASGSLSYWNPVTQQWLQPTDDTRIRLFGGVPPDLVSTDPVVCGGAPFCFPNGFENGSTLFTGGGVQGPSMIIDRTSSEGALHAHLDWFMEHPPATPQGNPVPGGAVGAYMVTMRLTGAGLTPSNNIKIMFNNGLTVEQFAQAIQARMRHTVTAVAGTGGTVSPSSVDVRHGSTTNLTVAPLAGYGIANVTGCGGTLNGSIYTTGAITTACTVNASFTRNSYTITASAGSGGSITPATRVVEHGSTATFNVTPAAGYSIASVVGCGGTLSDNTYTTGAITSACAVSASFTLDAAPQFTISATAGSGGHIEPASIVINEGGTASFTVTEDAGYSVADVTGCGGTLNGRTFTTGAITAACSVAATFHRNQHTVLATASGAGTVTPTSIAVDHGATASFDLLPQPGNAVTNVAGCSGTLNGNVFVTAPIEAPCTLAVTFSAAGPTFEPAAPPPYEMNATGLFTQLPADATPRATDASGRTLQVTLLNASSRFAPGSHVLTWQAVDPQGAIATVEQRLRVHPTVSLGTDTNIGFREGNSGYFTVQLNGPAPSYPFTVDYTVTGPATGHDLQSGQVEFLSGELSKEVYFAITQTAPAGSADQQLTIELAPGINRGTRYRQAINLLTLNAAPVVTIKGEQAGQPRALFARADGPITLWADILDPDSADTHVVRWQAPTGAAVTEEGGRLVLTPSSLSAGIHYFEAIVTDGGTPANTVRASLHLPLQENMPPLPDGATGWTDSGLPDHPDYSPLLSNVLPQRTGVLDDFVIEADPGLRIALGPYALLQRQHRAEVQPGGDALVADGIENTGGYFDFVVRDLGSVGQTVNIVIPQRAPIPGDAIYRKYNTVNRTWQAFVENGRNLLASAPGSAGKCPPPGATEYRSGLNSGDWCVQLTLEDGGPNDADGQRNGAIADPGGVGTTAVAVEQQRPPNGGEGSMHPWLLLALIALVPMFNSRQRGRRAGAGA